MEIDKEENAKEEPRECLRVLFISFAFCGSTLIPTNTGTELVEGQETRRAITKGVPEKD
jgi:hypothetical protein